MLKIPLRFETRVLRGILSGATIMYCAFTFLSFKNSVLNQRIQCFTHPLLTSLYRFKQKLMYNIINFKREKQLYFLTLTISDNHYDQITKTAKTLSGFMRSWNTLIRNKIKKQYSQKFSYVMRIEQGSKSTKRLHLHAIVEQFGNEDQMRQFFIDNWHYADWNTILQWDSMRNEFFTKIKNANVAAIYAAKYLTKSKSNEQNQSIAETKQNLKPNRFYFTSRDWEKIPDYAIMRYNPEVKIWEQKLRFNWKSLPRDTKEHVKIVDQKLKINGNYYQYAPWTKIEILNFEEEDSKEGKSRLEQSFDLTDEQRAQLTKIGKMFGTNRKIYEYNNLWRIKDSLKEIEEIKREDSHLFKNIPDILQLTLAAQRKAYKTYLFIAYGLPLSESIDNIWRYSKQFAPPYLKLPL